MTAVEEFTEVFRTEHRQVRDLLLELIGAFRKRDVPQVRTLLAAFADVAGPHFRYEEEAMYPELAAIFGRAYVDKLLTDHDRAIRDARELLLLAGHDEFTEEQARRGTDLIRQILPLISGCDGLNIMIETLPDEFAGRILSARTAACSAGLNLLTWAGTTRERNA